MQYNGFSNLLPLKEKLFKIERASVADRNARILQISLNIPFRPIRLIWSMRTNSFYDNESVELSRNLLEKEFYIKRFISLRSFGYRIVFPAWARYALFLTYCILSLRLWFGIFGKLINLSFIFDGKIIRNILGSLLQLAYVLKTGIWKYQKGSRNLISTNYSQPYTEYWIIAMFQWYNFFQYRITLNYCKRFIRFKWYMIWRSINLLRWH